MKRKNRGISPSLLFQMTGRKLLGTCCLPILYVAHFYSRRHDRRLAKSLFHSRVNQRKVVATGYFELFEQNVAFILFNDSLYSVIFCRLKNVQELVR